jgi:hypothetical protein
VRRVANERRPTHLRCLRYVYSAARGSGLISQKTIDGYTNVKGASEILGLTRARVQQLADAGKLPCLTTVIGRLFPRAEIEAIAAARKKQAANKSKKKEARAA